MSGVTPERKVNVVCDLTISQVESPVDTAAWNSYVQAHPLSSGYHQSLWRKVLTDIFGHQTFYYLARGSDGAIQGVLPLVLLSSPLFGKFLVSIPFLNYGGLIADTIKAEVALFKAAEVCAQQVNARHIELRHLAGPELPWQKKDHKVSMRLDLPRCFDDLMKAFPPKLRSQVRRGEKEGMYARTGGALRRRAFKDSRSIAMKIVNVVGTPPNFEVEGLRSKGVPRIGAGAAWSVSGKVDRNMHE